MSANYEHFIPVDPKFVPSEVARERAKVLLERIFPKSDDISLVVYDNVEFLDAGGNFERVLCPVCKAEIDPDWWGRAMDKAYESLFDDLRIVVPCCGGETSLNDLTYELPQRFATFRASVFNNDREFANAEEIEQLEEALGCRLRVVLARY